MVDRAARYRRSTRVVIGPLAIALTLAAGGCSSGGRLGATVRASDSLTIDKAFDLKTADPGRDVRADRADADKGCTRRC